MEKVICNKCSRFCGLIKDDGTGPHMDDCDHKECPMIERLARFAPCKVKGYDIGTDSGPLDADSGGYQSIAIRAMEDSSTDR